MPYCLIALFIEHSNVAFMNPSVAHNSNLVNAGHVLLSRIAQNGAVSFRDNHSFNLSSIDGKTIFMD